VTDGVTPAKYNASVAGLPDDDAPLFLPVFKAPPAVQEEPSHSKVLVSAVVAAVPKINADV